MGTLPQDPPKERSSSQSEMSHDDTAACHTAADQSGTFPQGGSMKTRIGTELT